MARKVKNRKRRQFDIHRIDRTEVFGLWFIQNIRGIVLREADCCEAYKRPVITAINHEFVYS